MKLSNLIYVALFLHLAACSDDKPTTPKPVPKDNTVVWTEKGSSPAKEALKVSVPLTQVADIKTEVQGESLYLGGSGYVSDNTGMVRQHRFQIVKLNSTGVWEPVLETNYGPTEQGTMLFPRITTFATYNNETYILREVNNTHGQVFKVGANNSLTEYGPEFPDIVWPKIEMAFSSQGDLWVGSFGGDGYKLYRLRNNQWEDKSLPSSDVERFSSHTFMKGLHVDREDLYVLGVHDGRGRIFKLAKNDRWNLEFETDAVLNDFTVNSMTFSASKGSLTLASLYKDHSGQKVLARFYTKNADSEKWITETDEVTEQPDVELLSVISTGTRGAYGVLSKWVQGVKLHAFFWFKDQQALVPNRYALGEPAGYGPYSSLIFQDHLYFIHFDANPEKGLMMSDFGPLR